MYIYIYHYKYYYILLSIIINYYILYIIIYIIIYNYINRHIEIIYASQSKASVTQWWTYKIILSISNPIFYVQRSHWEQNSII